MKKSILPFLLSICIYAAHAQVPQALNYQAVARTSQGLIIPNQQVGVRFSILEGSPGGTLLYQETGNTTTNNFGLFTMAVGNGIPLTGTFSGINWANGLLKYLKVEVAPGGGTAYSVQGTSILMSVPYALYSEKTKLLAGNNTITITNSNTITGNYVAGNNTVQITGNAITGNYVPANNTVLINGNTIAGNYIAGNNTVQITGNAITGNYVPANNTVLINGNTIAGNYVAGAGINIIGNTISSTGSGSNYWLPDANGIYYQNTLGGVGIGGNTEANAALAVTQKATGGFSGGIALKSADTWHTVMRFDNTTTSPAGSMQFNLAGSGNTAMPPRAFSLYDGMANRFIWNTDGTNNGFLAIGSAGGIANQAKSRLHVFVGDVNIDQIGSGIILKSPNGQCWRITIDNSGNLVRTAITCP